MASSDLRVGIGPDLDFLFEAPDTRSRSAIASALSCFAQDGEYSSKSPLVVTSDPPAKELIDSHCVVLEEPPLTVLRHGDGIRFAMPGIDAWCNPAQERAGIALGPLGPRHVGDFVHMALPPMLVELAIARGWIGLHAAAVSLNGDAVLLPGDSGCGKTTIFRNAVNSGLEGLSDDLVWLHPTTQGLRVYAYPRKPVEVRGVLVSSALLKAIVCPQIVDEEHTRMVRIEPNEALDVLIRQGGFLAAGGARLSRFRALVRIAGSMPAFRLEAGRDYETVPGMLERLLSQRLVPRAR